MRTTSLRALQLLHHNPLFVRSHDFAADTFIGMEHHVWQAPLLFGVGSPAGGGAHLVGSLAELPYVLAGAEQDFIAPGERAKALIWREVVPWPLDRCDRAAMVERQPQRTSRGNSLPASKEKELLAASEQDEVLRDTVMSILNDRITPQTSEHLEHALRGGNLADVLPTN